MTSKQQLNEVPMWGPVPLQCGERIFVRGEIWEVQMISNAVAIMVRVSCANSREAVPPEQSQ